MDLSKCGHDRGQVALSRGGVGTKEMEQQLQQALQHAAAEQQKADDLCSQLQQLQETLHIKDACLKDATAALNEAKAENRRSAAALHVSWQLKLLPLRCRQ
jgi:uncharacterized protein YdgA (DUF945 family)